MKNKRMTSIVIVSGAVVVWLFGYFTKSFGWEAKLIGFLNSNFFIALITLIAGSTVYHIYKKQKREYKADAAKLIIQEIRYAEQQIRNARIMSQSKEETNYYMGYKILPTNSWHKNIHFFVEDLKEENQIDLISHFYSQATYLDSIISIISDEKNKTWNISKSLVLADEKGLMKTDIVGQILSSGYSTLDLVEKDLSEKKQATSISLTLQANKILSDVSNKIEFVYNSPAVDKLRSIADGKL